MHHHHFHHGEKDTQSEWKGRFQPQVDPPKRPAGFRGVDPAEFHHAQQKLPYYLTMRSNNPLPPVNMLGLQVSIKNFRLITRFRIRMQIWICRISNGIISPIIINISHKITCTICKIIVKWICKIIIKITTKIIIRITIKIKIWIWTKIKISFKIIIITLTIKIITIIKILIAKNMIKTLFIIKIILLMNIQIRININIKIWINNKISIKINFRIKIWTEIKIIIRVIIKIISITIIIIICKTIIIKIWAIKININKIIKVWIIIININKIIKVLTKKTTKILVSIKDKIFKVVSLLEISIIKIQIKISCINNCFLLTKTLIELKI